MSDPMTIESSFHLRRHGKGAAKDLQSGVVPARPIPPVEGRLARVTRLMALAHRFDALLRSGQVADHRELARLGRVSRPRVSQILQLLLLAPDIQEEVLFLPPFHEGRAPLLLADLLPIARTSDWVRQRRMWQVMYRRTAARERTPTGRKAGEQPGCAAPRPA
jgi:hypothetical protein